MKKLLKNTIEFIFIFSLISGILPSLACGILYKIFGL